jgi:CRISPR system Cascade subunit CasC
MTQRIDFHILQNFAPANLNRDDTGSPKDCDFGGYRRARISSQCLKRSCRQSEIFKKELNDQDLALRTKRLYEEAVSRLVAKGLDKLRSSAAVQAGLEAMGLKLKKDGKTEYLLFLGSREISTFVDVVAKHFDVLASVESANVEAAESKTDAKVDTKASAKKGKKNNDGAVPAEIAKEFSGLLDGGKAVDLALFGRMLADKPEKNVEAACQVAHSLSTNRIHSMEMDYYTAVDDLKPDDNQGADMIGTVEFNSACHYRFSSLDIDQLVKNLDGDKDLARSALRAYLLATIHAIPTGKQNSFAAQNLPSLIFGIVHSGQPVSLANAFLKPVTPTRDHSLVDNSVKELDEQVSELRSTYGESLLGAPSQTRHIGPKGLVVNHLGSRAQNVEDLVQVLVNLALPKG